MAPYKKSKEEGCCSVNFLKYVLFIFNFVFFLAGCAVLGVGIWTIVAKHQYVNLLTSSTYVVITYLLVVAGGIAILVSIIGCVGVGREDRCALLLYTFMLLLIFLMEVVAGIMAYVYEDQVLHEVRTNLNSTFIEHYYFDADKTITIDSMQREYKCCGALSYEDWKYSLGLKKISEERAVALVAPESCCITESNLCAKFQHPSNIYERPCVYKLVDKIREHLIILGAVGLGISFVQVFGMIFSCCLYVKLKDDYDDY